MRRRTRLGIALGLVLGFSRAASADVFDFRFGDQTFGDGWMNMGSGSAFDFSLSVYGGWDSEIKHGWETIGAEVRVLSQTLLSSSFDEVAGTSSYSFAAGDVQLDLTARRIRDGREVSGSWRTQMPAFTLDVYDEFDRNGYCPCTDVVYWTLPAGRFDPELARALGVSRRTSEAELNMYVERFEYPFSEERREGPAAGTLNFSVVPEPSLAALCLIGLGLVGVRLRRVLP